MKVFLFLIALAFGAAYYFLRTVQYGRERFWLTRAYLTYDSYKDDPNNISPREIPRIAKKIMEVQLPESFSSRIEFVEAVFAIHFPGYGVGWLDRLIDPKLGLSIQEIEIPRTGKSRIFVARENAGSLTLIDDFLIEGYGNTITDIRIEKGFLRYHGKHGGVIRSRKL